MINNYMVCWWLMLTIFFIVVQKFLKKSVMMLIKEDFQISKEESETFQLLGSQIEQSDDTVFINMAMPMASSH